MAVQRTEMRVFRETLTCDECGAEMTAQQGFTQLETSWRNVCRNGHELWLPTAYPTLAYEPMESEVRA